MLPPWQCPGSYPGQLCVWCLPAPSLSITVSWSSAFPNRFLTVDHRSVSALSPLPPLRCTSGSDIYSRYSTLRSCARLRPVDRHPPALALHSESKHASLSRGRTTNTPGSLCLARGYELYQRFTPITHGCGPGSLPHALRLQPRLPERAAAGINPRGSRSSMESVVAKCLVRPPCLPSYRPRMTPAAKKKTVVTHPESFGIAFGIFS